METAVNIATTLVLAPLAKEATHGFLNDPWFKNVFHLNKIERLTARTDRAVRSRLRHIDSGRLNKRDALIDNWARTAQNSTSEYVRSSLPLICHVAATVAAFNEVGVSEVVLRNARHDMVVIGNCAFERNPDEILPRIVKLGMYPSSITELEAWGYTVDEDEVISTEDYQLRCAFIYSLVDIFLGTWTNTRSTHNVPSQEQREVMLKDMTVSFSWMTSSEKQNVENRLQSINTTALDIKTIANEIEVSGRAQDVPFLNIFVIGMRGTGKSTTRWLITGRGREDVSETTENTTRYITSLSDVNDRRLLVWDTPGLGDGSETNRYYLTRIYVEMMSVSHISTIMLQITHPGRQTSQEKEMLKEYNVWFGGNLSNNLMIVFKAKVSNRFRGKYIEDWERTLQEIGVGKIGAENYVFFSANTAEDDDQSILLNNDGEVSRVMKLIERKQLGVLEANRMAARALLESEAAQEGERRQKLLQMLQAQNHEETDAFREMIRLGRRVNTVYRSGQLHVSVVKYERVPNVGQQKPFGRHKRKCINKIVIQATCHRTKRFLEQIDNDVPPVRRGESDYWIKRFFDEQYGMQLMSLTKVRMLGHRVLHLFAEGIPVEEETVRIMTELLGRRRTLEILESEHNKLNQIDSVQKKVEYLSKS